MEEADTAVPLHYWREWTVGVNCRQPGVMIFGVGKGNLVGARNRLGQVCMAGYCRRKLWPPV